MKQIIAMGGGGFSMEMENSLLDSYILKQAGKRTPKVCFVPTASGDGESYTLHFHGIFSNYDCEASHLSLFRPPTNDLESYILEKDIIYVGGGNTKNMLALWKEWGLDKILFRAWQEGIVLAGLSAGSICWFEEGVTDSIPGNLTQLRCLGFLKGSNCPHYDGEVERRPAYHRLVKEGMMDGLAADDGVALHYVDDELFRVVSSTPNGRAYQVKRSGSRVIETEILPEFLGKEDQQRHGGRQKNAS